ncbi:ribosome-binding protein aMBF1 (putative translation factor) [Staphylococcus auricularis]|uniref:HTH cro/C1-type domain-containing protein n=1 Tax=Staphylococcus auricularis TaxID=29379 RepID=A0AAP8PPF9_9STAP|nr:helix-turn-helix transcriptional regulator [Staphylococcus auricularis]MBM0868376.1 XRE family transcriptional regulator [Staphylococcus auricularis]PNZ67593.1 hypothetical protein CD158_05670 [Staphylococcus auricularis]QPT06246.1 helix-turn-helix transcriptional regulator [Staphylococcus auricularis]SQJ17300.1 Uncharacterized protein conserved in bacteria [Staphylococcus auricularis]BCU53369.1 hypothetical protein JCM2421_21410 [Staphylococcus auricularis]
MLAEYLKEARESKDLTQEDVAQKLFVTRQTISRCHFTKCLCIRSSEFNL